jgi:hypothetical protein
VNVPTRREPGVGRLRKLFAARRVGEEHPRRISPRTVEAQVVRASCLLLRPCPWGPLAAVTGGWLLPGP